MTAKESAFRGDVGEALVTGNIGFLKLDHRVQHHGKPLKSCHSSTRQNNLASDIASSLVEQRLLLKHASYRIVVPSQLFGIVSDQHLLVNCPAIHLCA